VRAVLALAFVVALAAAACGGENEATAPPPDTGARQAPEVEGLTIDGKRLSLADFRGQPVFVNVWAAW
jgi:hypothetical protein